MAKILIFRLARASGSWDNDMRQRAKHNAGVLDRAGVKPPPTCHDDVTWQDFQDYVTDVRTQNDPKGSKET